MIFGCFERSSHDRAYPKKPYDHFGFVVTGGIGAYFHSETTLELIEGFMQMCSDQCDDQTIFNTYYMQNDFKFKRADRENYRKILKIRKH